MDALEYLKIIQNKPIDQNKVGIALGAAIKDPEVKPESYENLLNTAISHGFFISNIELSGEEIHSK